MLLYIGLAVVIFIAGYLVGANNPLSSVKKKIAADAQNVLNKVK